MDDIALTFWYTTQYLYSFFVSFHQKTFFAAQESVFSARTFVRIIFYLPLYAMGKLPIGISPAIRMIQAVSQAEIQVHKYRNQNGKDEKRLPAKCR